MLAVLRAKFRPGSGCAQALLKTQDAFLLEHNSVEGRDKVWSDNCNGDGTNWLGMQLMLLRDELRKDRSGGERWTHFITKDCQIDLGTGDARSSRGAGRWQGAVRAAARGLLDRFPPTDSSAPGAATCLRPGCGKPTWNGTPGEYCSHSCKGATGKAAGSPTVSGKAAMCNRPGCGKPSWNGQPSEFCSKTCRDA